MLLREKQKCYLCARQPPSLSSRKSLREMSIYYTGIAWITRNLVTSLKLVYAKEVKFNRYQITLEQKFKHQRLLCRELCTLLISVRAGFEPCKVQFLIVLVKHKENLMEQDTIDGTEASFATRNRLKKAQAYMFGAKKVPN